MADHEYYTDLLREARRRVAMNGPSNRDMLVELIPALESSIRCGMSEKALDGIADQIVKVW